MKCNHTVTFLNGTIKPKGYLVWKRWKKMIQFHHDKVNDLLKLVCMIQKLLTICCHSSTTVSFIAFLEDELLTEKLREDEDTVFSTCKSDAVKTKRWTPPNNSKANVGIIAGQLIANAMYQARPTGLHRRWEFNADSWGIRPRSNKTRSLEDLATPCFQNCRTSYKIENIHTTGNQENF